MASRSLADWPLDWLFFDTPASDRKLRLFSVACCRRAKSLIQKQSILGLLDLAERFAEGHIDEVALRAANREEMRKRNNPTLGILACLHASADVERDRARRRYQRGRLTPDCIRLALQVLEARAPARQNDAHTRRRHELGEQMRLLHDILGPLPVCDILLDPRWLTSDVLILARGIYEEKAFDRMPILGDALQDAGCDSDDILDHCRARNWEHVRGCWVIDLLLGRPWREDAVTPRGSSRT